MNIKQIDYFLTLAKTLNYSKAAKLLYISQPALSRQIILMEDELRLKLFDRGKTLKLTPVGALLEKEFIKMMNQYYGAITRANNLSHGVHEQFRVGILEGLAVDDLLEPTLNTISAAYPDIDIVLLTGGYEDLAGRLYDGSMDIIFTRKFDIEYREGIDYTIVDKTEDFLVLSNIPRFDYIQAPLDLSSISSETLAVVMETEYDMSKKTVLNLFSSIPEAPEIKGVSTYHAMVQWVKSGLYLTFADQRSILPIDGIRALPMEQFRDPSLVLAWSQKNSHSFRTVFESLVLESQKKPVDKFSGHLSTRWKGLDPTPGQP